MMSPVSRWVPVSLFLACVAVYLAVIARADVAEQSHRLLAAEPAVAGTVTAPAVIVVLGYEVHGDAETSPVLVARLQAACAAMERYPSAKVVLSGGQAAPGEASEASVMLAWLQKQCDVVRLGKLPSSRIILESASYSTRSNAVLTAQVLGDADVVEPGRLLLVTNMFHQWRSSRVFRAVFPHTAIDLYPMQAVDTPVLHQHPWLAHWLLLREVAAIVYYLVYGFISWSL